MGRKGDTVVTNMNEKFIDVFVFNLNGSFRISVDRIKLDRFGVTTTPAVRAWYS